MTKETQNYRSANTETSLKNKSSKLVSCAYWGCTDGEYLVPCAYWGCTDGEYLLTYAYWGCTDGEYLTF